MLNMENCSTLQAVNESGFVLQELVLYLDTHPTCTAGLARYQLARQAYQEAVERYQTQNGPLMIDQNDSCSCWQWIQAPWPWEMED